ncbi:LIM domain-containing protein A-like [Sphaeramia orbicularis]|uniref:LIM domain-containing protein A-like n=1 Tax=Sphaeramia orbicularis TaxID=375764 RepID=UPI001180ED8B|nr:LIM domain-containing protein A-like [Sphaeramia orbicularis]
METHVKASRRHQEVKSNKDHQSEMCDDQKDKHGKSEPLKRHGGRYHYQSPKATRRHSEDDDSLESHSTTEDSVFNDHHHHRDNHHHHKHPHQHQNEQNHRCQSCFYRGKPNHLSKTSLSSSVGSSSTSSSFSSSSSSFSSTSSSSSPSSSVSSSSSSLSSEPSADASPLWKSQHSQSCTDVSRRHGFIEDDNDDTVPLIGKGGCLNRPSAKHNHEQLKPSDNSPTEGTLKTNRSTGKDGSVRKAKSMESLSRPKEKDRHGNKDENQEERRKSDARKNLMEEKMKFSAFLNEITRQVLSPLRLNTLGVTDARRPPSPGQASVRSKRTEDDAGRRRQSSRTDSISSSKHSQRTARSMDPPTAKSVNRQKSHRSADSPHRTRDACADVSCSKRRHSWSQTHRHRSHSPTDKQHHHGHHRHQGDQHRPFDQHRDHHNTSHHHHCHLSSFHHGKQQSPSCYQSNHHKRMHHQRNHCDHRLHGDHLDTGSDPTDCSEHRRTPPHHYHSHQHPMHQHHGDCHGNTYHMTTRCHQHPDHHNPSHDDRPMTPRHLKQHTAAAAGEHCTKNHRHSDHENHHHLTHHHGDHQRDGHHHHHRDHHSEPCHHHGDHQIDSHSHHHGDHHSEPRHHHGDHQIDSHSHHHGDHHSEPRHHHGDHHSEPRHHRGDHQIDSNSHHHGDHHSESRHHHGDHHSEHCHHHGDHHSEHCRHHGDHQIDSHSHHHGDHRSDIHSHHHGDHHTGSQRHCEDLHSIQSLQVHLEPSVSPGPDHTDRHVQNVSLEKTLDYVSSRNSSSSSSHHQEDLTFTSSVQKETGHELGQIMILQEQNEGLQQTILKTAERMESLGEEFMSSQRLLEEELQQTRTELSNLTHSFKKLHENCSSSQQTNNLLEEKLQLMTQSIEGERQRLNQRITALTEQLTEATFTNSVEALNVISMLHTPGHDVISQVVLPITPPPAQFMDGQSYGKDNGPGQEQCLGAVPEEEESDWSEMGEDTPTFTLRGSNRGPAWRPLEMDTDRGSETGEHSDWTPPCPPPLGSALLLRSASLEEIPLGRRPPTQRDVTMMDMMELRLPGCGHAHSSGSDFTCHWRTTQVSEGQRSEGTEVKGQGCVGGCGWRGSIPDEVLNGERTQL